MKLKKKSPTKELKKGQVWKLENGHIQIVELGKRLTHYKLLTSLNQQGAPVRLSGIQAVQDYLAAHGARLIRRSPSV